MKRYIGVKIVHAEPAYRYEGKVYPKSGSYPKALFMEDGYRVVYLDGYESWCPKDAFEQAYRETTAMTFGVAIEAMKEGKPVKRLGWNGKGIFIGIQNPDENSKMTQPYIYIDTMELETTNPRAPKGRVPWLASQTDMLAEDWVIAGE